MGSKWENIPKKRKNQSNKPAIKLIYKKFSNFPTKETSLSTLRCSQRRQQQVFTSQPPTLTAKILQSKITADWILGKAS